MKIERLVSGAAAVALALGLAASANANIVTVTYQGVVTSGTDQTDLFGLGTNLTGASYTAVYTIDDSVNARLSVDAVSMHLFGGTHYAAPIENQTPVTATMTINGVTVALPGAYWGNVFQSNSSEATEVFDSLQDIGNNGVNSWGDYLENKIFSRVNQVNGGIDFHVPLTYTLQPGDASGTSFSYFIQNDGTGIYSANISAFLQSHTVTIVDGVPGGPGDGGGGVPGVPEPTTWALLMLGVGLVGFAARRRHEGAAAAA